MLPRDVFCRSIEFPKDFPAEVLDLENFFLFQAEGENYVLSVASRFLLRTLGQVHEYGRGVVSEKNEKRPLSRELDRPDLRKYVGVYEFFAGCIMDLDSKEYTSSIRWKPEGGRDEHFQVELIRVGDGSEGARKKARRRARQALSDGCFGPEICPTAMNDEDLKDLVVNLPRKIRPV